MTVLRWPNSACRGTVRLVSLLEAAAGDLGVACQAGSEQLSVAARKASNLCEVRKWHTPTPRGRAVRLTVYWKDIGFGPQPIYNKILFLRKFQRSEHFSTPTDFQVHCSSANESGCCVQPSLLQLQMAFLPELGKVFPSLSSGFRSRKTQHC